MRNKFKLCCYIDDYVPQHKADKAFKQLCSILQELGLLLNDVKLTPPNA